jgi:protein O-GlcNAc transferase
MNNEKTDSAEALNRLGRTFQARGQFDEARKYYKKALRITPGDFRNHQNFVFSMVYDPGCSAQTIFSEHLKLAKKFEGPLLPGIIPHTNDRTLDRRLRIGYVSPDFRRHSVAYFIEPVLSAHNKEHFEIFCYSIISPEDEVTARIRGYADHGNCLAEIDDGQAAELIRKDRIDILVDLAGHTHNSRPLIFARKPAPVQASWIGYPATTGFSTIDYKIVDAHTDPPRLTERFYSEKLVRLPGCFLCFLPDSHSPEVGPLPALTAGEITFGSFNDFAKETEGVIELWSAILKRVPDSMLILKGITFGDGSIRNYAQQMFAKHGIKPERIELLPFSASFSSHMDLYNQIDIALDPFPYNGVTTTCEALWMGVPVITLEGNTHASRAGASLLSNIGLAGLIADKHDEYIDIAVKLASDLEQLKSLRMNLRERIASSPLTDAKRFTSGLEMCYREMWQTWCGSQV